MPCAEKVHCAIGMEERGVSVLVATALKASSRTFQQRRAFIAPFHIEQWQKFRASIAHSAFGNIVQIILGAIVNNCMKKGRR